MLFFHAAPPPPPAVCQVCAIEVHTSSEMEAVNGSTATLTCTFTSSSIITKLVSVDWSYKSPKGGPSHSVSTCTLGPDRSPLTETVQAAGAFAAKHASETWIMPQTSDIPVRNA